MRAKDRSFNADFKLDLDSDLPKIKVIPQDIGRVLLNLINNAFQAVADFQGFENLEGPGPKVEVTTKSLDGKIEVSVSDNGPGIPDEIKEKVFQPFFTTKPTGEGTGLGLSLSYDIIKSHGGKIEVESKVGKGTKFTILLPIV
jgi:signal transduction histidine kinase